MAILEANQKVEEGWKPAGGQAVGGGTNRSSAGVARDSERTYITGITVAIAGILSFFAALVSAYIVRKGSPAEDWRHLSVPHILWLNTAILAASSFTLSRSRKHFLAGDESGFQPLVERHSNSGPVFLAGQIIAWRQLSAVGIYLSTNPAAVFIIY